MQLSFKYWKHHMGRTIVLLCTIMISTMAMTIGVLLARSASEENVQRILDKVGDYDIVAPLIEEGQLHLLDEHEGVGQWGLILNGGKCRTEYSTGLRFGAMDSLKAQEMFHYEPEKGRYPQAEGEICGYKSSFESLGVAAVVGNRFKLEMYDTEGNFVWEKEYTIVGVLNDQKDPSYYSIRSMEIDLAASFASTGDLDEKDYPELFVYRDEIPECHTMTALILCEPNMIPYSVTVSIREEGIQAGGIGRRLYELACIAEVEFETEQELLDRAHMAYNDFYSSWLIPAFLGIVLAVSFISIYGVMSGAMMERQKQLGLLRAVGMKKRTVRRMLLGEGVAFCSAGTALGYGAGVLLYALYIQALNVFGQARIYSAFHVHPITAAVSLSPYVYPWLLGIIFSILAVAVPLVKGNRLSPNEMLFPEKLAAIKEPHRERNGRGIIRKIVGGSLSRESGVAAVIVITGWSFVFGAVFMLAKSDEDSYWPIKQLEEVSSVEADYSASKDFFNTEVSVAQYNRHDEGISAEDMAALKQSGDTALVRGVMKLPGLKLLYHEDSIPEELEGVLEPLDISHNVRDFLWDLHEKSKKAQGYELDDLLYSLPAVAVDGDILDLLGQYVVSGEIDREGLMDGSRVIIAEYHGEGTENPYKVGDRLDLTDTVIDDEFIEGYDFSTNQMPEGYPESFRYDYTDGSVTDLPGYSFGERVDFQAEVCAVLSVDDEILSSLLYFESQAMTKEQDGCVSPGYGIICSMEAPERWGLPDCRYTDVYVNLEKHADIDRFETLWYTIIGKSGKLNRNSKKAIETGIARTEQANMELFASMILMVIVAGCFGMANSYSFAVRKNMRNLQILRAVGMSRKKMIRAYVREMFFWPFVAAVTSVVPVQIFDMVRKYAYNYAFQPDSNGLYSHAASVLDGTGKWVSCWQVRFPWYIEMWEQPVILPMAAGFIALAAVNICAGTIPMRRLGKMNVAEGIRDDSF